MRVGFFTRYAGKGASSRVRAMQFAPALKQEAIESTFLPLLSDEYIARLYKGSRSLWETARGYTQRTGQMVAGGSFDLLWIEKELFPYLPAWIETAMLGNRRFVLDLDDAIFHNYDLARSSIVRALLGRKIDRLMARAALVTAGNDYLADRARQAGAQWVEVLPTVIDLDRYPWPRTQATAPAATSGTNAVVIGWIGSPATVGYLQQLAEPLQQLAQNHRVQLNVIGGGSVHLPGIEVVSVPWSESTEVHSISQCDIGVMPLNDSPWERGKCGYKLIQYMACGLPVVASPVGVNTSIVSEGLNGYLAADSQGWLAALQALVRDPALRARLGAAGRAVVETDYCLQVTAPRLAQWLHALSNRAN